MGKARIIIHILMVANNRTPRWSLASSALSPFIRFWNSLTALQAAAVISTLVLTIGAVVEYWSKLKLLAFLMLKWIRRKSTPFDRCIFNKLFIHSIGPILVVLGIAGEVIFEGRAFVVEDTQEEQARTVVGSLKEQAGQADKQAKQAITDSSTALSQAKDALGEAGEAQESLGAAESEAKGAKIASANALTLARDAQHEADSFETDIVAAKQQAADAESHLADAMKRATALTTQLDRLTTPRSLPHSPQVVASLKPFKGTEYMFTEVCEDTECINLLRDIDSVLGLAGWKRLKAPHTFPGLVLWGDRKDDDGVGIDLEPGIEVSIESTIPDIEKSSLENLPEYLRAAVVLNSILASNVSPPEKTGRLVDTHRGTSTVVRISVGRKPLP